MSRGEGVPQPPAAPEIHRKFQLRPAQVVGVSLLAVLPVLALLGLFGESHRVRTGRTADLSVALQSPARNRYGMINGLQLEVTNTSSAILDTVTVDLDTVYLSRFSDVVAIPDFEHPYTIELNDLEPGETRRVRVEFQGERFGRHSGELRVTSGGADTARLPLATFIFP